VEEAWNRFSDVYEDIGTRLQRITVLSLDEVAPSLTLARELDLAVPGTFRHDAPFATITAIVNTVPVISSKQRPRKLAVVGSDGVTHQFLLKGHEDLRLDERIMQLFGLLNALFASSDHELQRKHFAIGTFSVIPLSADAGLLGWILQAETYNELVRHYREVRGIAVNTEHKLMEEFSGNLLHTLTIPQKVETYHNAINATPQHAGDLSAIIRESSQCAEDWLEKRNAMARALL
jgi:FKBP12-rapamycin complex-associated protein